MTTIDETKNDEATDLMDTLNITKVDRRTTSGGAWVKGTMGGHRFNALVFPEHAEQPEYELDDSHISKLWVQRISDRAVVVNFGRGWDVRPMTPVAEQIVELLAFGLAEFVFDFEN